MTDQPKLSLGQSTNWLTMRTIAVSAERWLLRRSRRLRQADGTVRWWIGYETRPTSPGGLLRDRRSRGRPAG